MKHSILKQAMQIKGYKVSEGDDWTSADAVKFQDFAYFELQIHPSELHKFMTYDTEFPQACSTVLSIIGAGSDLEETPPVVDEEVQTESQPDVVSEPLQEPEPVPEPAIEESAPESEKTEHSFSATPE